MPSARTYKGSCHCGAIRVQLKSATPAAKLAVRACQCGFCTRHGVISVCDPKGKATIEFDEDSLVRYQFASFTSEYIVCANCGTYVGAFLRDGKGRKGWSIANVRGLALAEFADRAPEKVEYEGEEDEARIARRKANWTPTELKLARGD